MGIYRSVLHNKKSAQGSAVEAGLRAPTAVNGRNLCLWTLSELDYALVQRYIVIHCWKEEDWAADVLSVVDRTMGSRYEDARSVDLEGGQKVMCIQLVVHPT